MPKTIWSKRQHRSVDTPYCMTWYVFAWACRFLLFQRWIWFNLCSAMAVHTDSIFLFLWFSDLCRSAHDDDDWICCCCCFGINRGAWTNPNKMFQLLNAFICCCCLSIFFGSSRNDQHHAGDRIEMTAADESFIGNLKYILYINSFFIFSSATKYIHNRNLNDRVWDHTNHTPIAKTFIFHDFICHRFCWLKFSRIAGQPMDRCRWSYVYLNCSTDVQTEIYQRATSSSIPYENSKQWGAPRPGNGLIWSSQGKKWFRIWLRVKM